MFCHGLESGPHGRKYRALVEAGHDVEAPDFRGMDVQQRVEHLAPVLRDARPDVVVGSSYGGLVALLGTIAAADAGHPPRRLVLCAPALARATSDLVAPIPTVVIHGVRDAVCPIELSRRFVERSELARLVEVDDEHRLAESLDAIVEAIDGP